MKNYKSYSANLNDEEYKTLSNDTIQQQNIEYIYNSRKQNKLKTETIIY